MPRTQQAVPEVIARQPHGYTAKEELIRVRAYMLWEEAGRPESDGTQFWLQAERELAASA
ncbi:MAG: DUF2934 domain-containing protein [Gemmataceae bacterium]